MARRSRGSIKPSDLSPETRAKLGLDRPKPRRPRANRVSSQCPPPREPGALYGPGSRCAVSLSHPPSLNKLYRSDGTGRRWVSKEGEAWKASAAVAAAGALAGAGYRAPFRNRLSVTITIVPRTRTAGGELLGMDVDNLLKVTFDGLNDALWVDDSQIDELVIRNDWRGLAAYTPGILVEAEAIPDLRPGKGAAHG